LEDTKIIEVGNLGDYHIFLQVDLGATISVEGYILKLGSSTVFC
jgi:hypothetical protein